MNKSEYYIKSFAGKMITESKADKPTKKQLLNFVKEADEHQVLALIMDGEIQEISEDAKSVLVERFKNNTELQEKFKTYIEKSKNK